MEKNLYLTGLIGKQIYQDMLNTTGEKYRATVKNWKKAKFTNADGNRLGAIFYM